MTAAPVLVRVLDNGLTVVLDVHRSVPRIAARVVARWGAGDDPRDRTGLAHLLEHLLANKGSHRLGVTDPPAEARLRAEVAGLYRRARAGEDVADALEAAELAAARLAIPNELKAVWGAMGGRGLNASTSHDRTEYRVDIPRSRLEAWARLEADRFACPAFRTFGTELGTVLEEIARSADDPNRASWGALRMRLFGDHPYGTPVLGSAEHVARATPDDAESFFRAGHGARNLVVCLAGDLDPDATLPVLERTLGTLASGAPRPGPLGSPAPLAGEHRATLQHEAEPEVRIAWRGVGAGHPDHPALLLADMLLDNRSGGLLPRMLVHPHRVRAAGAVRMTLREAGAHVLWARPLDGQDPREVEGLLLEGVEALQRGDFDPRELTAILRNFEVGELRRLEDPGPRAARLVQAVAWDRELSAVHDWRAPLAAVTPADIVRVARTHLGADRVVLTRTRGAPERRSTPRGSAGARQMADGERSAFARRILEAPVEAPTPQVLVPEVDYRVRSEPWGESISAQGATVGLGRLSMRLPLGTHHDRTWAHAVYLLDQAGAGRRSRAELESALYALGVSWDVSAGRVSTQVVLDGPEAALLPAMRLLIERLETPTLDGTEARTRIDELLLRRAEGRTSKDVRGSALDRLVLKGEDSEFLGGAPSADALRALAASPLAPVVARLRVLPLDVCATGSGDLAALAGELWTGGTDAPPDPPVRYGRPDADRVLLCHQDGAQARVALLCPGDPLPEVADAARRVWHEILGGAANLLFQEIRESRGLAYSTRGAIERGRRPVDDTVLWAVTLCDARRAAEVATLTRQLLADPQSVRARFQGARDALVARDEGHRIRPRAVAGTVAAWRRAGLATDPRPARRAALAGVTLDEVLALQARWSALPRTVAILGDLSAVERGALAALGTVEVVGTADLFAY